MTKDCHFCDEEETILGIHRFNQVSVNLAEILEEESCGKKEKIRCNQISQNNTALSDIFKLGDGFSKDSFNSLALEKLRKQNDDDIELGKVNIL